MNDLIAALVATGIPFAHYFWDHAPSGSFGIYSDPDLKVLKCDGQIVEKLVRGTVDLFVASDDKTDYDKVELALSGLGDSVAWELISTQLETDTMYMHYEWSFTIYG